MFFVSIAESAGAQGNVHKKKEVVQDVTLHDLDAANAKPQVGCLPYAMFLPEKPVRWSVAVGPSLL